jgi:FtsZ-interacting cell division protein ZipA
MSQTALIVVAIVVVVGVILVAMLASRARRRRALRDRFGPEYDRALAETGSAGKAESLLGERV